MYYKVYKDVKNEWRWTLFATNGKKIADSAESYHNRIDCLNGIELVKGSIDAPVQE